MVIVHFTQFSYGTLPITPFSKIFNEDEIEFRFDELPIEDIQKEYSKNVFDRKKIRKDLPFEFEVDNSIGQSFYFVIYHNLPDDEIIEKKMESTFNSWNSKLEKSNSISPIHNLIKEKFLPSKYSIFYLDLGYTGFKALNLFLGNLQKIEEVSKVYLTVNCEDL
ncbi:MAG: hypothetical protein R2879_09795 [Saprospiraceae bacterium]